MVRPPPPGAKHIGGWVCVCVWSFTVHDGCSHIKVLWARPPSHFTTELQYLVPTESLVFCMGQTNIFIIVFSQIFTVIFVLEYYNYDTGTTYIWYVCRKKTKISDSMFSNKIPGTATHWNLNFSLVNFWVLRSEILLYSKHLNYKIQQLWHNLISTKSENWHDGVGGDRDSISPPIL